METALHEHDGEDLVVIDSLRSPAELAYVRDRPEAASLVAVVCDKAERRQRIEGRDDTPATIGHREQRELSVETEATFDVGHLIAVADYYIDNSGTRDVLDEHVNTLITEIHHHGVRS